MSMIFVPDGDVGTLRCLNCDESIDIANPTIERKAAHVRAHRCGSGWTAINRPGSRSKKVPMLLVRERRRASAAPEAERVENSGPRRG